MFFDLISLILQREELSFEHLRLDNENYVLCSFQNELRKDPRCEQVVQQKQKLLQDNAKKYHEFLQENFHRAFGFIQRNVACGKSE